MAIKMIFNDLAKICGFQQTPGGLDYINNGYTCIHPENIEREKFEENFMIAGSIGKCYCWACPSGTQDPDNEENIIIDDEEIIEKIIPTCYWFEEIKEAKDDV